MSQFNRRSVLKGVSAGTAGLLLAPLLSQIRARADGKEISPKRVVFVLFDNGFSEQGVQPTDIPLAKVEKTKRQSLAGKKLPFDIEPLSPFQDRMTIIQGLLGHHLHVDHGGGFRVLSGLPSSDKVRSVVGESIDAAIARVIPGVFPLLALGIAADERETVGGPTAMASSAWGASRPIASLLRPELVYESLFGSVGGKANDFQARRNVLDFIAGDVKRLRKQIAGPERESLDYHIDSLESLRVRDTKMSELFEKGLLQKFAPTFPEKPATMMTEISTLQFEMAAAALVAGLTNVVTISSGLCQLGTAYTGITEHGTHALGHNERDPKLKLPGSEVLGRYRNHLAKLTAGLLKKLESTREGSGTMLDNTTLVFMSDSANRQHTQGENWPIVLIGNLGGRLKVGELLSYPLEPASIGEYGSSVYNTRAIGMSSNPVINALYCTLLHAVGAPRDEFHFTPGRKEVKQQFGPLAELLA